MIHICLSYTQAHGILPLLLPLALASIWAEPEAKMKQLIHVERLELHSMMAMGECSSPSLALTEGLFVTVSAAVVLCHIRGAANMFNMKANKPLFPYQSMVFKKGSSNGILRRVDGYRGCFFLSFDSFFLFFFLFFTFYINRALYFVI